MIQDIYPHKFYNQYEADAKASAEDTVLVTEGSIILVRKDLLKQNRLSFPQVRDFDLAPEKFTYLFAIDTQKYFLLMNITEEMIPAGYEYVAERELRTEGIEPEEELFAAVTGKHLADWYRDTCFCGRCGSAMKHSLRERAKVCEACGYTAYPRIMPAVIVGVINGDSLLLTKYRTGFAHNALIAGFTEIGETVEETVSREVMEEAGIRVKNIRYYKSQPWGTANDILLGFYCEVDGDDTITMDSSELKYAQWVKRDEIVLQPGHFSLTNEMMERFKNHMES